MPAGKYLAIGKFCFREEKQAEREVFSRCRIDRKAVFGSCFLKLFLRTVFDNTENTILGRFVSCF